MNVNEQVVIRRASADDAALLAELGARTFFETFATQNTPENMAAYLASSFSVEKQAAELSARGATFLIADIQDEPAGFAHLRLGTAPPFVSGSNPIEIARIYATKQWIGRGVGATLMRACLEEAGSSGCDTIWLGVWEQNPRAIDFYRKWGFVVVGTQTFKLGSDPQRDLVMQRRLSL